MKKAIISSVFLFLAILLCLFLNKKTQPIAPTAIIETNKIISAQFDTNPASSSLATSSLAFYPSTTFPTNELFNPLTATNLQQWKQAVRDLKQLGGIQFHQSWIREQEGTNGADRNNGISLNLKQGAQEMKFVATFITMTTKGETDNLLEVELQSPNMNIEETKALGLQLCSLFSFDSKGLIAWCDQTGNNWNGSSLYGTGNYAHTIHIRHTFSDEKPWYIALDIGP